MSRPKLCGLGVLLACASCAEIRTRTETKIHADSEKPVQEAFFAGSAGDGAGRRITSRRFGARWRQQGPLLDLWLTQWRTCQVVYRVPVIRETRTIRTADAGLYWEFGIAAVAAAIATVAFMKPEAWSSAAIDETGKLYREASAGYTIGGLFTGIGALALIAGIHDVIQIRDSIETEETFVLRDGPATGCDPERAVASGISATLVLGTWRHTAMTDADGHVQVQLPTPEHLLDTQRSKSAPEGPQEAGSQEVRAGVATSGAAVVDHRGPNPSSEGPSLGRQLVRGSIKVGRYDAVAIDILLPYVHTQNQPRELRAEPSIVFE